MKVIFLDIDGVLNNAGSIIRFGTNHTFDPQCVDHLNWITDETGARLVVSSNWREGIPLWQVQSIIGSRGVRGDIIGMTPDLKRLEGLHPEHKHVFWVRPLEVRRWLDSNPWVARFAILDDHLFKDFSEGHFKTDIGSGLTHDIAGSVIRHLSV